MRIGLDIDNVITDFDKKILKKFYKEDKNKRNNGIVNPNGNWIKNMFDWSKDEVENFFNQNMQDFAKDLEPRKDAKYYMDKLLKEGHSLYLISHRGYPHYTCPYKITEEWLKNNHINYTKLILSKTTDKSRECKENNIDVMFDDVRSNCRQLQENGIKCYLMGTKYNQKKLKGLKLVKNWKELYEVINNMEKKKVILDTDMYNEIDDQFALTYLIKSLDVFDLQAITIAPFSESGYAKTDSIQEGTEKSYETTLKILDMLDKPQYKDLVYKGA